MSKNQTAGLIFLGIIWGSLVASLFFHPPWEVVLVWMMFLFLPTMMMFFVIYD